MTKTLTKHIIVLNIFIFIYTVGFSQILSKEITIERQTLTVLETCNLLQREYKIKIAYSNNDDQLQKQIELKAGTYNLENFLKTNFGSNNIQYQLNGEQLIIIPVKKNSSEKPITISGFVEDEETGEKLPGANIYIPGLQKGTVTNNYGFFTITLPGDISALLVTYTGYKPYQSTEVFDSDTRLTVKLEANKVLEEVVVTSSSKTLQSQTQMSKINVPVSIINNMPRFLGEADLLKTLQLLPGVNQGMEGTSGIFVRGGSADQNLILLDGTPVYNASHLFGIFSTFNTNALKSVDVYKGGFPARFGSRLSSVIDIITKDGNMKEMHGEANIGLLASSFTLEGPLKKNKTSFVVSARRTYMDLIAAPIVKSAEPSIKDLAVYFYDLNLKLHHIVSPKDRLFFSVYNGNDVIKFKSLESIDTYSYDEKLDGGWGNTIATIRWNHVFNKKLFANTLVNYTQYRLKTDYSSLNKDAYSPSGDFLSVKYFSGIYDIGSRIDFDYRPQPEHSIKFGTAALQHTFTPGILAAKKGSLQTLDVDEVFNNNIQNSPELLMYAEDDWQISSRFRINVGVHANAFKAEKQWYRSIQPRVGFRYLLPKDIAFKASYTHMNQYIHLLTNNITSLPTDLWVPSTDKVKPMLSRQVSVGFAKSICNNKIDISIEGYYKKMERVIEYVEGASYLNSSTAIWESQVEAGKGEAYGTEFFIQKKTGKTTGWIGYTLSYNNRVFPTINYGRKFPYKYDRRHDFELVIVHTFNSRWEISGSWQFQTGTPFTVPTAAYEDIKDVYPYKEAYFNLDQEPIGYINGRNQFRLLNYHRLDISVTWKKKKKKHYERSWNFSLYNAYNKRNPFFYYLDRYNEDANKNTQIIGLSLLPIMPSITYSIKF